jgi:glutathione S-transferase
MTDLTLYKREATPPRASLGWGDADNPIDAIAQALATGPYLLGDRVTAADVVIGSGVRFGMMTKSIPERPEFVTYVARLLDRPAFKRSAEKDQAFAAQAS